MKSILTSVIALGFDASTTLSQLTVNTPSQVINCQPVIINWTGGTPPYFLTILPGNQPTGSAIVNLGEFTGNTATWFVNILQQYKTIILNLRDSTGAISQSAPINIQDENLTCDTKTTSVAGATVAASGSGSIPTGNSPASPTTTASSQNTGTTSSTAGSAENTGQGSSGGSSTPSSTSPTSTKSAGASRVTGQIAVAGILGAAMVALLG